MNDRLILSLLAPTASAAPMWQSSDPMAAGLALVTASLHPLAASLGNTVMALMGLQESILLLIGHRWEEACVTLSGTRGRFGFGDIPPCSASLPLLCPENAHHPLVLQKCHATMWCWKFSSHWCWPSTSSPSSLVAMDVIYSMLVTSRAEQQQQCSEPLGLDSELVCE